MKISTIVFCRRPKHVLLGMKKRGFGTGKWNGCGGKVKKKETPQTAAVREAKEEFGLIIKKDDLEQVGLIWFYFENKLVFRCHVFSTRKWRGLPKESDEMKPRWFLDSLIPYKRKMWVADGKWIPLVLADKKIEAIVRFDKKGEKVLEFSYKEVEFD